MKGERIPYHRERPKGTYPFDANPPEPGLVMWWIDNGEGGGWIAWAPPDWDGSREQARENPSVSPW